MNAFTPIDFGELVPGAASLVAAGTNQATALLLRQKVNVFISVPSGTGVLLPSSYAAGTQLWILNRDGANTLLVYPSLGDQIENNAANTPISVPAGGDFVLTSFDGPLARAPRVWWQTTLYRNAPFLPLSGGTVTGPLNLVSPLGYQQSGHTVLNVFGSGDGSGQNTVIGLQAGALLPANDIETTAIGWHVLASCTGTTLENTGVGWGTLRTLTTGSFHTAVGVNCGGLLVTDTSNALFGNDVMRNATGSYNVAAGNSSMRDGVHNSDVAVGHAALSGNGQTGANTVANVAIGYQAMLSPALATAGFNVMIGWITGQQIVSAQGNTGVGAGSLQVLIDGFNNAAYGLNTGAALTGGFQNSIFGPGVGSRNLKTGSQNLLIGTNDSIDTPAGDTSNTFMLGGNAIPLMRATFINTATPAFFLDWLPSSPSYANDAAAAAGFVEIGQIYRNGSVVQCRAA